MKNVLRYLFFLAILVIGFSITGSAQDKPPPKPKPPVIEPKPKPPPKPTPKPDRMWVTAENLRAIIE